MRLVQKPSPPHRYHSADEVASLCQGARQHGNSWRALCPVHQGDNPTALEISTGDNGKTILYCHAHACPVGEICAALGIAVHDLDPYEPAQGPKWRAHVDAPIGSDVIDMFNARDLESRLEIVLGGSFFDDWSDPVAVATLQEAWGNPQYQVRIIQAGVRRGLSERLMERVYGNPPGDIWGEQWEPQLVQLSTIKPQSVEWLWSPYLPIGKLTLMVGDPGQGKSWLTLALTAAISTGLPLPGQDGSMVCSYVPSNVLLLSREDGVADTVVPRLLAMGADLSRVHILERKTTTDGKQVKALTLDDVDVIEQAVKRLNPLLCVIDPVQAFIPGGRNLNNANEVREILSEIALLAERHRFASLTTMHMNKATQQKALYRASGSIDFAAIARSMMLVARDPEQETPGEMVVGVMSQIKNSLMMEGVSLGFSLSRTDGFSWRGPVEERADSLISAGQPSQSGPGPDGSSQQEAQQWLLAYLGMGPLPQKEVQDAAENEGISPITLRRAKKKLGVQAKKQRRGWYWELPAEKQGDHPGDAGKVVNPENALANDHLQGGIPAFGKTLDDDQMQQFDHLDHLDHLASKVLKDKEQFKVITPNQFDHLAPDDHLDSDDQCDNVSLQGDQDDQDDHAHSGMIILNNNNKYIYLGQGDQDDQIKNVKGDHLATGDRAVDAVLRYCVRCGEVSSWLHGKCVWCSALPDERVYHAGRFGSGCAIGDHVMVDGRCNLCGAVR